MRINLRYQLVLFSDYSTVRDDPNTQELFLGALQDYGFALRPLVEATIGPAGVTSQARPSFSTSDGAFSISINSDKATFDYVYTDINVSNMISIADFLEKVFDVGSRIGLFSERHYRRVGLIRHTFYDEVDVNRIYSLFCNHIKFYDSLEMKDWSVFLPAKKNLSDGRGINATSKIAHINTSVRKNSAIQPFDGIAIITDVNTLASNNVDNIPWESMKSIIREIQRVEYDITNQTCYAIDGNNLR